MSPTIWPASSSYSPGAGRTTTARRSSYGPPATPHILGAYSYLAVGQYTAFNGIQGHQERRLHFAGEQTSLNFQGYVEGALRSGYRCADETAKTLERRT